MADRIAFDRSLYLPEAVDAAAAAYSEHAQIEITPTAEAVVAAIAPAEGYDVAEVVNAFCNHVLHETIALRREAILNEDS